MDMGTKRSVKLGRCSTHHISRIVLDGTTPELLQTEASLSVDHPSTQLET